MSLDLAYSCDRGLHPAPSQPLSPAWTSSAEGLLALATAPIDQRDSASARFWYRWICAVITDFCVNPGWVTDEDLPNHLIQPFAQSYPVTMPGAENLSEQVFRQLLGEVKAALSERVAACAGDHLRVIAKFFPDWQGVGRVHFHLAENPNLEGEPFLFLATYGLRVPGRTRLQHAPLGSLLERGQGDELHRSVQAIQRIVDASPIIAKLITSRRIYRAGPLSQSEAMALISDHELFKNAGIQLLWPKDWSPPARLRVRLEVQGSSSGTGMGIGHFIRLQPVGEISGTVLAADQLARILGGGDGLIKVDGRWVVVESQRVASIMAHWQKAVAARAHGIGFAEAIRILARVSGQVTPEDADLVTVTSDKDFSRILTDLQSPGDLSAEDQSYLERQTRATLRPYQRFGVSWLLNLTKLGVGGILADDMGLGKTLQVIAFLHLWRKRHLSRSPNDRPLRVLIIAPASLLANWQSELQRFGAAIPAVVYHSSWATDSAVAKDAEVVVTTFGQLVGASNLISEHWQAVVIDEAQAIKNISAQKTRLALQLNADFRLAMTGTPVENRLDDLFSICQFTCPEVLGSRDEFRGAIAEQERTGDFSPLRKLMRPFLLRRLKTDSKVIANLPAKIDQLVMCPLTKDQRRLYRQVVDDLTGDLTAGLDERKRRGRVLAALTALKQICNHPAQYLGHSDYVYDDSGKFFRLADLARDIASRGEKILVFTQYREITDILQDFLTEVIAREGLVIHGGTPVAERGQIVDRFQAPGGPAFLVLSVKACGYGLNLTAATHVIHFDRWWNPAVENQATDRAFRIGQTRTVFVHKFVCMGTIEQRIDKLIADKKSLLDEAVGETDGIHWWQLSNSELVDLLKIEELDDSHN